MQQPDEEMHYEMHDETEKAFHDVSMEFEHGESDPYTEYPTFPAGFQVVDDSLSATGNMKDSEQVSSLLSSDPILPEDFIGSKEEDFETLEKQELGKEIEEKSEVVGSLETVEDEGAEAGGDEIYEEGGAEDQQQNEVDDEEGGGEELQNGAGDVESANHEGNGEEVGVENSNTEGHAVEEEEGVFAQDEEEYDDGAHYLEDEESRDENYDDERYARDGGAEPANDLNVEHDNAQDDVHLEGIENGHGVDVVDENPIEDVAGDDERGLNDLAGDMEGGLFETDDRILDEEEKILAVADGKLSFSLDDYLILLFLLEVGNVESVSRKRARDEVPLQSDISSELPQKRLRKEYS